jgi:alkane 1-monooxygenase
MGTRAAWVSPTTKKFGYLLLPLLATLPFHAWWLAGRHGGWDAWAFFVPAMVFVVIPILDALIGQDPTNPLPEDEAALDGDRWYRWLPLACLPLVVGILVFGAWVMATAPFSWVGHAGWVLSVGCVGGLAAINPAHELIHKTGRLESTAGGLLLACVGYGSFKVEHVYGHHVAVGTPGDTSTAPLGDNVYAFIGRAFAHNLPAALRLEREACARRGKAHTLRTSEIARLFAFTALLAAVCAAVGGWLGLVFFIGQAIVAITLLEVINFVEHYGLERRRLPGGRWEKVDPTHSWNSNFVLSNLVLFQLQRHSDHHAHALRRYQLLRHFDDSPQLPGGYGAMVLLALVPWAWRRVMDPRVARLRAARPAPV